MAVYGWSAPEVGEVVERAAEVGRRIESSPDIAPAIANLWIFNIARGRIDRCDEISGDLFRMARELDDPEILLQAHHCGWATRFFQARFDETAEHLAAGVALYDEERHAHHRHVYLGHDPYVCSMNFGASLQTVLGFFGRAHRLAVNGIALARRLDHAPSLANSLWRGCEAFVMHGDREAVFAHANELIHLTDVHGLPVPRAWGLSYLGWALAQSGEFAEGMARLDEGQSLLAAIGAQVHATFVLDMRAECLRLAGRYAEGLEQAEAAVQSAEVRGELSYLSRLYRTHAALRRHIHGAADPAVEASFNQALAVARRQQAKGLELGAALDLARHWAERGRRTEARELLAPVHGWFTEGFETADLKDAKALLDDLA
jgi:predicted ATPase